MAKKAGTAKAKKASKENVKKAEKEAVKTAAKNIPGTQVVPTGGAKVSSDRQLLMMRVAAKPLHSLTAKDKLLMPLHACLDNGPGAKCTLMRYNPKTNQYDIDEGDIDCSQCTHFVQPTQ